jgi:hypothetical protein
MPLNPLASRVRGKSDLTPETNEAAVGMAWAPGVDISSAVITGTVMAVFIWRKSMFRKVELSVGLIVEVELVCCYRDR